MSEQEIEQMAKYAREYYPEILIILDEASQALKEVMLIAEPTYTNEPLKLKIVSETKNEPNATD